MCCQDDEGRARKIPNRRCTSYLLRNCSHSAENQRNPAPALSAQLRHPPERFAGLSDRLVCRTQRCGVAQRPDPLTHMCVASFAVIRCAAIGYGGKPDMPDQRQMIPHLCGSSSFQTSPGMRTTYSFLRCPSKHRSQISDYCTGSDFTGLTCYIVAQIKPVMHCNFCRQNRTCPAQSQLSQTE